LWRKEQGLALKKRLCSVKNVKTKDQVYFLSAYLVFVLFRKKFNTDFFKTLDCLLKKEILEQRWSFRPTGCVFYNTWIV